MAKTLIDIDEDLLREAMVALGTSTKKDTVNAALASVAEAARAHRRDARLALTKLASDGGFDFDRLAELDQ